MDFITDWKEIEICMGMNSDTADQIGYRGEAGSIGGKFKEVGTYPCYLYFIKNE